MAVRIVTDSAATSRRAWSTRSASRSCRSRSASATRSSSTATSCRTDEFWRRLAHLARCCPRPRRRRRARSRSGSASSSPTAPTGIVCINLSSRLSATMQSAQVAAKAARGRRARSRSSTRSPCRWASATCASPRRERAADGGSARRRSCEQAPTGADRTKLFGALDTLEYLKRGGRIGNAQATPRRVLSIKPVDRGPRRRRRGGRQGPHPRRRRSPSSPSKARGRADPQNLAVLHGRRPTSTSSSTARAETVPRDQIDRRPDRPGDRHPRRSPRDRRRLGRGQLNANVAAGRHGIARPDH